MHVHIVLMQTYSAVAGPRHRGFAGTLGNRRSLQAHFSIAPDSTRRRESTCAIPASRLVCAATRRPRRGGEASRSRHPCLSDALHRSQSPLIGHIACTVRKRNDMPQRAHRSRRQLISAQDHASARILSLRSRETSLGGVCASTASASSPTRSPSNLVESVKSPSRRLVTLLPQIIGLDGASEGSAPFHTQNWRPNAKGSSDDTPCSNHPASAPALRHDSMMTRRYRFPPYEARSVNRCIMLPPLASPSAVRMLSRRSTTSAARPSIEGSHRPLHQTHSAPHTTHVGPVVECRWRPSCPPRPMT
ncbi:hypothetical protein C8R45DRAFT_364100 [Mycena sanguinolenta]|nr:hypothetical protein C8R45DRAFT_364100 [Mycena sanguinolenta]